MSRLLIGFLVCKSELEDLVRWSTLDGSTRRIQNTLRLDGWPWAVVARSPCPLRTLGLDSGVR